LATQCSGVTGHVKLITSARAHSSPQKKRDEITALQQQADARESMLKHLQARWEGLWNREESIGTLACKKSFNATFLLQADRETHTLHIASLEVHVAQLQRRETALVAEQSALREQLAALHEEKALFLEQVRGPSTFTESGWLPGGMMPASRGSPRTL
jgi:hypothetical protein